MRRSTTWISRRRDRVEVRKLSGQNGVPVLVLEDGKFIAGSTRIAAWAAEHPPLAALSEAGVAPSREIDTFETEGGR